MSKIIIKSLDKIVVTSIILSILTDNPNSFSKYIFSLAFIFSIFNIIVSGRNLKKDSIIYLLIVSISFVFLLLIGISFGSEFLDAIPFFFSTIYLYYIIIYSQLSGSYKILRYIKVYAYCSVALSLKIILYYFLYDLGIFYEYLPIMTNEGEALGTWVGHTRGITRVFSGQAVVLPTGLLFLSIFIHDTKYRIFFVLLGITALILSHTVAVMFFYLLVMLYVFMPNRRFIFSIIVVPILAVICIAIFNLYWEIISPIIEDKLEYSVPAKLGQLEYALSGLKNNFLLGNGLGYRFPNGSTVIEVIPFHIIATTGILGACAYLYLYLYWVVKSLPQYSDDLQMRMLLFGYFTIIGSSFSNPYLLGGGSGMFLIPLIAARYSENSRYSFAPHRHSY